METGAPLHDPRRLQTVHGYVTDAFPGLDLPGDAESFELGVEEVRSFEEQGFLGGVRVLEPEQVGELRRRVDRIRERARELAGQLYEVELAWTERPDEVVFHCLGGWLVDEWLHDLIFHPAITVPAAQLLGVRRLRFWHDQVFAKPPRHVGVVPWHQDYAYWTRAVPASHITIHVALDDADDDNGCIQYVPGSHRWGLFPPVEFGGKESGVFDLLPDELRAKCDPVPVHLRAGEAVIHHSHTIHGSGSNPSDRPRRALAFNYMGPDTRSADGQKPLLKGVPLVAEGDLIAGDYFPIVLER